jgi:hypothetical protein
MARMRVRDVGWGWETRRWSASKLQSPLQCSVFVPRVRPCACLGRRAWRRGKRLRQLQSSPPSSLAGSQPQPQPHAGCCCCSCRHGLTSERMGKEDEMGMNEMNALGLGSEWWWGCGQLECLVRFLPVPSRSVPLLDAAPAVPIKCSMHLRPQNICTL